MEKTKFACLTKYTSSQHPQPFADYPEATAYLPMGGGRVIYSRDAKDIMGGDPNYDVEWEFYQCIYGVNCPANCQYNHPEKEKNCPQGRREANSLAQVLQTDSIDVTDVVVFLFALIGLLTLFVHLFRKVKEGCTRKYHKLPETSDTVKEDFTTTVDF